MKKANLNKLLIFGTLLLVSVAQSWADNSYYAKMIAKVSTGGSTGKGTVYVSDRNNSSSTSYGSTSEKTIETSSSGGDCKFYLFAQPSDGYELAWWSTTDEGGNDGGVADNGSITVKASTTDDDTEAYTRYAVFKALPTFYFSAIANVGSAGGGTASVTPTTTSAYGQHWNSESANATATFTATPNSGYEFYGWSSTADGTTIVSSNNPYSATITSNSQNSASPTNTILYAVFKPLPTFYFSATASVLPVGAGVVTATPSETSKYGEHWNSTSAATTATYSVTSTAAGYKFLGWSETTNGAIVSEEQTYSRSVTSASTNSGSPTNTTMYARFVSDPTGISVTPSSLVLNVGETGTISTTLEPNPSYRNIKYTSTNTGIATVTSEGIVTGVSVGETTITVQAVKIDNSEPESLRKTVTITVKDKCATPTISFSDVTVDGAKATLSSATTDATIYYTINGSAPTASSTPYTAPFAVESGDVIRAIAIVSGTDEACWSPSDVLVKTYTAQKVATPSIVIGGDGTISFTCSEEGTVTYTYCISDDGDCTPSTVWNGTPIAKNLANNEKIIKVIASKEGCADSDPATKQYTASGVSGTTVVLNDYEDHNWTYYAGVDLSVDGGNYNTNYAGKIYSPDPRNVKITYQANGGAVSIDEDETEFVYYKTIEKNPVEKWLGTGDYPYQVISNPFSKRPKIDNKIQGFNGWEIVEGGDNIQEYGNGDVIPLDAIIHFVNLGTEAAGTYTPNCTSAEIVLKANWVDANVQYGGGNVNNDAFKNGTYETNLLVINANYTNALTPSYPVTIMMVEPDGSADYRDKTFSGAITPADLHDIGQTTKIEWAQWTTTNEINAQGRNFIIGRGIARNANSNVYGTNTTVVVNQIFKVESGKYRTFCHYGKAPSAITKQVVVFGNDYDRAKKDDNKLDITGSTSANCHISSGITYNLTDSKTMMTYLYSKSGKIMSSIAVEAASTDNVYYFGPDGNDYNYKGGCRYLNIQGGEWCCIAGGFDNFHAADDIAFTFRMSGGTLRGSIYGAGEFYGANGSRVYVITGGLIKGWVAAGANGTQSNGGEDVGTSYVYVGGKARIDSNGSNTKINKAVGGNVFGAGCGYSSSSSSGEMRNGTNVVVADDAYVERGVYGGGGFGFTTATSNVYVTGGTVGGVMENAVPGGVYGGAQQNKGGNANIYMTGGKVFGGIYGGSNSAGTLSGSVKMVVAGGQVGSSSVPANVHGGGYGSTTVVSQNVDVTLGLRDDDGITSGTAVVYGDVYGGSALGKVNGTTAADTYHTNVTLNAGTIHGSLYGGALGNNTVAANVYGPVAVKVYGGSVNTTTAAGSGAVYGCNNLNGAPQSTVAVDIYGTDPAPAENQYALDAVYGGGNMADYAAGTPTVKVHNCDNSIGSVYGGGNAADIKGTGHGTNVTIYGGNVIGNVFGGGNGEREGTEANVTGNASVTIHGGTILNVFGGSNTRGTIGGTITVNIDSQGDTDGEGSADACTMNVGNVYGGGNKAASNVGTLNIGCTGTDGYIDAIYGGANAANITGNIALNITGGNIGNVFGGNNASGTISGKVDVTIGPSSDSCDGIQIANVYGGGNKADMAQNANVVTVNINGDDDAEIGNVYGGGKLASVYSTNVYLRGGTVTGNVFGGGMGSKETTALANKPMILNGGTHVYAFGGTVANIFGGNDAGGTINGGLNVIVDKTHDDEATDYGSYSGYGDLEITGDVYGGGNEAASAAGAVNIKCANAIANVFGGAKNADVTGDIVLTVGSGQIGNVYGGNNVGGTAGGNITVNVSKVSGDCGNNFKVGNVFGGGYGAGTNTGGNVTVNITDVAISGDVYGGSALGNVNTGTSNTTAVNLLGGSVTGNVYGGGLGDATTAALVKGNVTVTLGNTTSTSVIGGSIYGANNVNGTPKGTVNVIVNKTTPKVGAAADDYDVAAVYGGGNQAAYVPDASIVATAAATVTVNGCDNSIQYVYGGGNAAPVPATHVIIYGGDFEYVFGGGNGAGEGNPGANVGYKTYADDADEDTKAAAAYGSGNAIVNFYGGSVNHLFGGSNTKGNIKGLASVNIDEGGVCPLVKVDEAYAAGNEAYMEGGAKMNIGCVDLEFPVIYGGAKKADVGQDIVLNITSGKYQKVFGGNNLGGKINGSITVNVDETGCHPVTIGELYGGGNMAAYSIYGYEADGTVKTSGTKLYDDPVVNIVSCTSIGTVYGGGYGTSATVVGNPTVNINQIPGKYAAEIDADGDGAEDGDVNAIGTIVTIFGGGNAAPVQGNTFVNIGTEKGTLKHVVGDDDDDIMDLEFDESSANIRGNVYGGGNKAVVTGNTKVVIGPEKTAEP